MDLIVDCGANVGARLAELRALGSDGARLVAFEPNPALLDALNEAAAAVGAEVVAKAVWTEDGSMPLYLGHPESSTMLAGKRVPTTFGPPIDYTAPVVVETIDFASWLADAVVGAESVIVKMDIEGAEYPVLERMTSTGTAALMDVLLIEWHHDRFPDMERDRHDAVFAAVSLCTAVHDWR